MSDMEETCPICRRHVRYAKDFDSALRLYITSFQLAEPKSFGKKLLGISVGWVLQCQVVDRTYDQGENSGFLDDSRWITR